MSIFSGISGITYNGDSGKASLGLTLPNGFLENLASKSDTFSYMRTSANSNMTIQNGYASAYYAILKLIPTGVYSTSLSYDNMTKSDIRVDLDKILTVNYEIDRLDSNRSVENYQAGAQASAALTIRKTLNAHFLGL
jgi:hypothetical protein